ncbi:type VI secretion system tube protein TssD [Aquimarina longa]|uniref:type VI secretion system tube protein TssD n=1 Tax=Aquimarina longa TaxID=1080221 RepID=UPI00078401BB|nr:type VI secretion system tube protein TssD [Aquimarina longa]
MIQGVLNIDGETIKVIDYHYTISQGTDYNGMVRSNPVAGQIAVTLDVSKSQDTMLNEWALSKTAVKKGGLQVHDSTGMQVRKNIDFDRGYCVRYDDIMETEGTAQNIVRIVISCEQVSYGDAERHVNNWPQLKNS